jgi:catechol 2,3-dioxygenase-like lactoylglutathione lyase family enzyme
MIRGMHGMLYTSEPEALRAFLRDKLGLPANDVGGGWLIFDLPEADLGCHPAEPAGGAPSGTHDVSFYCDDVHKTVEELTARGVEFTGPVEDHGYGLVTHFRVPGGFAVQLYQPRYNKKPHEAAEKPACELTLRDERVGDGSSHLRVQIKDGALVFEGHDSGSSVEEAFGDFDLEYWLTVRPEHKDAVLLHLIKSQFTSAHAFRQWLTERGVPSEWHSY